MVFLELPLLQILSHLHALIPMLKDALKPTTKPLFNKLLTIYICEQHAVLRADYKATKNVTYVKEKNRAHNKLT
jgi:hypothetical protein